MLLMTKAVTGKARKNYPLGSDLNQKVVAKFFDPCSQWTWYLMNQDPDCPDYLWGIVKGNAVETGSFLLSDLVNYRGKLGIGIERDRYFKSEIAKVILKKLNKGEHV